MLQKSSTFTSLSSAAAGKKKTGHGFSSWFDRRARKLSMKCSRSITLGELSIEKASGDEGEGERESGNV